MQVAKGRMHSAQTVQSDTDPRPSECLQPGVELLGLVIIAVFADHEDDAVFEIVVVRQQHHNVLEEQRVSQRGGGDVDRDLLGRFQRSDLRNRGFGLDFVELA